MKRRFALLLCAALTACTPTLLPAGPSLKRMPAADLTPQCALTAHLSAPRIELRLAATCPDNYAVTLELTDGVRGFGAVGFHGGQGRAGIAVPHLPGWYALTRLDETTPLYFLHVP